MHKEVKRRVHVARKLGRKNPKLIQTDHFNLGATLDAINKIGSTVEKVSGAVNSATQAYNNAQTTMQKITNPNVNNGYPAYNPTVQSLANQILNRQPTYAPPYVQQPAAGMSSNNQMILLVVGGVVVLTVVALLFKPKN